MHLTPEALACLRYYAWPGHVHEFAHVPEWAVVLSSTEMIQPEELAFPSLGVSLPMAPASHYQTRLEAVEQDVLREAMQEHGGNKRAAVRALGIALSTLYEKLKKYYL
jgi:DNA-binding NtrC family response regulator